MTIIQFVNLLLCIFYYFFLNMYPNLQFGNIEGDYTFIYEFNKNYLWFCFNFIIMDIVIFPRKIIGSIY